MTTKVKRKVTVESSKESDEPRRPSVFERLGPGAGNIAAQPDERHSRTAEHNEKCRNWLRTGVCTYGSACRYTHKALPSTSSRPANPEKEMEVKDLRHKVKVKKEDTKESTKHSSSPKRKSSKHSRSLSKKGDHDSKIKSTVVVTRPRTPPAMTETAESKKKPENWEDDSDDWPMDAAQLDYKEELTLERKRQQLQRELELELQKELLLNEGVTITKTVSFSESSSTSSSSDSGSISSSSESSSSSSEGDSNESSSSTSSSSSSSSRQPIKRKTKKSHQLKEIARGTKSKTKDDFEKSKSGRSAKSKKARSPSPALEPRKGSRKGKEKIRERNLSPPSSKKRHSDLKGEGKNAAARGKGPRTPSPPKSRKQRQWAQSSSADSRAAEMQRGKGKRHKKKKDTPRSEKRKSDRMLSPPPLSSPNRLALLPTPPKKSKSRDESGSKRRRHRESSPVPPLSSANALPIKILPTPRYLVEEKSGDKVRGEDRGRAHSKRDPEDLLSLHKRTDSHERITKRSRLSPRKELRKASLSPPKERYDNEAITRKLYAVAHDKDKLDRRRASISPIRSDRRKMPSELDKKRDIRESPPRELHDSRRDPLYRGTEAHGYDKRGSDTKVKRFVSPEIKKGREDKGREHVKERGVDYDTPTWQGDHRKPGSSSSGRRTPEPRGRQEMRSQPPLLRSDRSRERDSDRKKNVKKRDIPVRSIDDPERARLPSPRRSESPLHGHHGVREIESLTSTRGRLYESDLPPADREYAYGYDSLHDPFLSERLLPSDYESDVLRGPSVYPSDVYSESRYRRGTKDPLERYESRDISPRDVLPHRDIISLTGRGDDYLPDLPLDERPYEDRWPRGRTRDDWDPYPSIPPAPLPPHVAAALDEDRYGMPRRRRASPSEWSRSRNEDRDTTLNPSHRPVGRGPPPREGRSRSPGSKTSASNRSSWNERSGRPDRGVENRQHEDAKKNVDDRKGRPIVKKGDKIKPKSESSADDKPPSKDKAPVKRPRSPSPSPQVKKKRKIEDIQDELMKYHGGGQVSDKKASPAPPKKIKEEPKSTAKTSTVGARTQKSGKQETPPPKSEPVPTTDKADPPIKSSTDNKVKEKDIRKSRKTEDSTHGEVEFSDWSDDDDDLLTRDDFSETVSNSEKSKHKTDENNEGNSRRKEKNFSKEPQDFKRETAISKDRLHDEASHSKDSKSISDAKEIDTQESLSIREESATDVDEYITAESVDYDPISDDELDALIEEPDDSLIKPTVDNEKSKIVDALDVNWSAIMSEAKTEFVPGFARQRFKAAHVLSRIGFSQTLAGSELSEKIIALCQKQLDEEVTKNEGAEDEGTKDNSMEQKKFVMEHPLAAFHVSISQSKRERVNLFSKVGPYRRALCARRDLQIRKILCKPLNKLYYLKHGR